MRSALAHLFGTHSKNCRGRIDHTVFEGRTVWVRDIKMCPACGDSYVGRHGCSAY